MSFTSLSIVIPFFNEEETAAGVLDEVIGAQPQAEILAVDDGSTDRTWEIICSYPAVRGLRLGENRGQSAAMYLGIRRATGALCALMDGDGQNDPADIAALVAKVPADGRSVVCGYRATRKDTWSRRAASRAANRIRRLLLKDGVRDTGCSLKVFPREAADCLFPFNGMHRYLPAFFRRAGYGIVEVPVNHRPRTAGRSKYSNWDRALRGIYDLFGVSWALRRLVIYPAVEVSVREGAGPRSG